jgi:initiation factor 1A
MVKNTTGGSRHKGLARKLVNAPVNDKVRLSEDECECYGKVTKMLGNGMCHVNLVYKDTLHENVVCHIRGKFRNRNKRSNLVSNGDTLLVGIRDWESNIDNCDLLFIYNENHIKNLSLPSFNISNQSKKNNDDDILFDNSNFNNDISLYNNNSISHKTTHDEQFDIDFDNI